jgi:hypothetical protein
VPLPAAISGVAERREAVVPGVMSPVRNERSTHTTIAIATRISPIVFKMPIYFYPTNNILYER